MKKGRSLGSAFLWVLLFIGVQILITVAVAPGSIFSGGGDDITSIISDTVPTVLVLSSIATVALALLITKLSGGNMKGRLGLCKPSVAGIAVPLLFGAAMAPLTGRIIELIPIPDSVFGEYEQLMDTAVTDSAASTAAIIILAPLCEELIFRGAVFSVLQKSFSKTFSVLFTAFLFGLVHFNPIQSSYAFLLGIILCLIRVCFDSLWASIAAHIAFNLVGGYVDITVMSNTAQTVLIIGCAAAAAALAVWMFFNKKRKA